MSTPTSQEKKFTIKDYKTASPRWCAGCGDYAVLVGLRKYLLDQQIDPSSMVNISGIGCSGRMPHYLNTFGIHSLHGRPIPVTLGLALTRPDLTLFIESGDGDAFSIGGNHLIHGINKNFNTVLVILDNQIYGLTKSQTSPTTKTGVLTSSEPTGAKMEAINPIRFMLGLGASFVASTADWLSNHFLDILKKAHEHPGFAIVHVSQRCPKYNPGAYDHKSSQWYTFMEHENGVPADQKFGPDAQIVQHDPSDLEKAFHFAQEPTKYYGLFYQDATRACYDAVLREKVAQTPQKDRSQLLDRFEI